MAAAAPTSGLCLVHGIKPPLPIKGRIRRTYECGDPYVSFTNVPYAAPPQGAEKFLAAKPFTPDETADQSTPINGDDVAEKMCIQPDDWSDENSSDSLFRTKSDDSPDYKGSSDCLYLNIYLPKRPEEITEPLPVLVYIHGGGFTYGSNSEDDISPDFIVQHDVVFVTMNYRLGILGFINMDTKEVPGNAGLKDQAKALEWIRDNIICFGGDPTNVTISGNSAGGTCVITHLVSPASKSLFHKAIVQSGGDYCPWGSSGHQREQKQILSRDPTFQQLLLATDESNKLYRHTASLLEKDREKRHPESASMLFGPTVEKSREGAFIPDTIEEMMKNSELDDIPVMAGITQEEGISDLIRVDTEMVYRKWILNDRRFCQFLMDNLQWSSKTANRCFKEIRDKYFPNHLRTSTKEKDQCLKNFIRDLYFRRFYDNFKFGPVGTPHKKLFVYRFDHVSEISEVRRHNTDHFHGATHGDELNYLYCPKKVKLAHGKFIYEGRDQNKEIREVIKHLCSLWANFCKSGVPKSNYDLNNVEWRYHTEEDPCFLSISNKLKLIEQPLYKEEWGWLNQFISAQPAVPSPASPDDSKTSQHYT